MIKAVIFDMDGTLIDSESIWAHSWSLSEEKFHFKLNEKFKKSLIGLPKQEFDRIYKNEIPEHIDINEVQNFRKEYFDWYISHYGIRVKPGVEEFFYYLKKQKIIITVATSTYTEKAINILKKLELWNYIDYFISGDRLTNGKPSPDIYYLALGETNIIKKDVIAIEDSIYGVKAACAAGIKTYMIPDIVPPNDEAKLLAHCICNSMNDIKKLMEEIKNE